MSNGYKRWMIDLRMQHGVGAYILLLLVVSELITLPTVAGFDLLIKGRFVLDDLLIGALTSPIVTIMIIAIVNPFVEHILNLRQRLAVSQRITGIGSWEWSATCKLAEFSEETRLIFSLDKECDELTCILDKVTDSDKDRVTAYLDAARMGQKPEHVEFCIEHESKGRRMLRMDSTPLTDATSGAPDIIGTVSDISERAEAQAAARNFMAAVEQSPDPLALIDAEGTIEFMNPSSCRISGYAAHEMVGKKAWFMRPGVCDKAPYAGILKQIRLGQSWHGPLQDRKRNGAFYPVYAFISPIRDEQGLITHYVCGQQDMSEKESLEQQLGQAQKMEALGTLVGGIAHDFNNMLGGITSNLFLARSLAGNNEAIIEKLHRADTLCFRSADMIKQLLAFARKDQVVMKDISLNAFIKEAMKLHASTIPENIRVELNTCSEQVVVCADAVQLQQILLNLLNNACHALSGCSDPRVIVRTRVIEAGHRILEQHPDAESKDYLCLSVSDNGAGIQDRHLHRIFEPFYTTKEIGEGSGLGLSMVYGAAQRHGGFVTVDSKVDEGSCFNLFLPLSEKTSGEQIMQAGIEDVRRGQGEMILLVDDDKNFLDAHKNVLEMLGYRCLTACNGFEAVKIFANQPTGIQLVLTDVVMPDMGGIEAAGMMRNIRHDIPILFATGYELNGGHESLIDGDETVLTKPFSIAELSRALRSQLES
ncbi:MAG: PAS domain S-box protein [Mariprofundaceae bacterium]|nr:PAS domain S-box protein [Mariprofundaceae bacterium]